MYTDKTILSASIENPGNIFAVSQSVICQAYADAPCALPPKKLMPAPTKNKAPRNINDQHQLKKKPPHRSNRSHSDASSSLLTHKRISSLFLHQPCVPRFSYKRVYRLAHQKKGSGWTRSRTTTKVCLLNQQNLVHASPERETRDTNSFTLIGYLDRLLVFQAGEQASWDGFVAMLDHSRLSEMFDSRFIRVAYVRHEGFPSLFVFRPLSPQPKEQEKETNKVQYAPMSEIETRVATSKPNRQMRKKRTKNKKLVCPFFSCLHIHRFRSTTWTSNMNKLFDRPIVSNSNTIGLHSITGK